MLHLYNSNIHVTFMIEIRELILENGNSPFRRWFDTLDAIAAAKVNTYLTRIENGNTSSLKSLKSGVYECKLIGVLGTVFISVKMERD